MGRRGPPARAGSVRSQAAAQNPGASHDLLLRAIPQAPDRLSGDALLAWERFAPLCHGLGRLAASDLPALEVLCETYAEYRAAADIADDPRKCYICNPETGAVYAHPAVYRRQAAYKALKDLLARFGLTPMDRGTLGVSIATGPAKQGLLEFAAQRGKESFANAKRTRAPSRKTRNRRK